jgi:small-conductance mechanosensitive channel
MEEYLTAVYPWLLSIGVLAAVVIAGLAVHWTVFFFAERLAARTQTPIDASLVRHGRRPARLLVPLFLLSIALPSVDVPIRLVGLADRVLGIAMIGSVAWLIVALLGVVTEWVALHYRIDVEDNLTARRMQTQTRVLKRTATVVILIVAGALMLMKIPGIEGLGVSLLASAGLAGIVVGMAARPTLSNLLAGLQLALTQPIRLDDVVIVEDEWGRIEEITNTYVVVRIWDQRRLVVPLTYFIERPFENWTRVTADILGTVFLYVDYTVPIEEVRSELRRVLEASGKWDGKVCGLVVTNATDRTVELRALLSAPDSGTAWDLRCHVREQLVAFLQRRYPECLPRTRAEVRGLPLDTKQPAGRATAQPA